MNPETNIEHQVRIALGDLTLQLIAARAEIAALKAAAAEVPAKVNGKGKEPKDEAQPRPQ